MSNEWRSARHVGLSAIFAVSAAIIAGSAYGGQPAARCDGASHATLPMVGELYTSEGCNSCPPADRWLSRALAQPRASGPGNPPLIALAFHVDYWDYLGWKDRFAQPAFAARQARLARAASAGVYTPQVFVNGREDRQWVRGAVGNPADGAPKPALAPFTFSSQWGDGAIAVEGRFASPPASGAPRLRYAVTEHGLSSAVKAGENKGETLRHDAVVRAHGEWLADAKGQFAGQIPLPADLSVKSGATQLHLIAEDAKGAVLAAGSSSCAAR